MVISYEHCSQYTCSLLMHVSGYRSSHIIYTHICSGETFSMSHLQHCLLLWLNS